MQSQFHMLASFWWVIALVLVIVCYRLILRLFGVVLIPENNIGIVDKRYAVVGRTGRYRKAKLWLSTMRRHTFTIALVTRCITFLFWRLSSQAFRQGI
jgi:hypothetical protein